MAEQVIDLAVIGGGINGVGIARDAAGRGLTVLLAEQGDLAGGTSSASSKLIHGGLRYLEHYEFRLVREALGEREVLLRAAPHIVWPLRFVLPHSPALRPAWMIRLGLFLYDHLGGRERLPASRGIDLSRAPEGAPLRPEFRRGFVYADCWVDDARLVVLNAVDAAERGASILTRCAVTAARRVEGHWQVRLADGRTVRARALVNAAGPWVGRVLADTLGSNRPAPLRLVRGSHIVVPRLHAGEQAYILQNRDRRIVFAIPYERAFTLIGTTDVPHEGDVAVPRPSGDEVAYLCAVVSDHFRMAISPRDVVHRFAGIRPLWDDAAAEASAVTRDYVLDLEAPADAAPLLTVFGGKITTYRRLAEHALTLLARPLGLDDRPWTRAVSLPGGDIARADFASFLADAAARRPWLPPDMLHRLARAYGTRLDRVLDGATRLADLGRDFGAGLSEAEVNHLRREEWAVTAEDILWRRSKLGLHLAPEGRAALLRYLGR